MNLEFTIHVCRDNDQQLYNDFKIFKVIFCIYLLANVLHELNILNKIFQIENVNLSQLGAQIELIICSLTQMFLDAKNFGVDSKYVVRGKFPQRVLKAISNHVKFLGGWCNHLD